MTRLSVNVACYNVEKHITRCLDSLVHQTMSDIEINCIDNGSTDRTLEIIEEFKAENPNINIHRNLSNVNLSGSRKNGLLVSKGEYAMLIDGDDWLTPNACQTLYKAITKAGVDVVECDCYVVDNEGVWIERDKQYCLFTTGYLRGSNIFEALLRNEVGQMTWNKIYRTELAKEAYLYYTGEGFFHKEDVLFTSILYRLCDSYLGITDKLYNYRKGSGSSHSIDYIGRLRNSEICFAMANAYYNMGALKDKEVELVKKKALKWINDASPHRVGPLSSASETNAYSAAFVEAWSGSFLRRLLQSTDPYALEIGKTWLYAFLNCIDKSYPTSMINTHLEDLARAIDMHPGLEPAQQKLENIVSKGNMESIT